MSVWMVRPFPEQVDRKDVFLQKDIIAVSWGIDDLTHCDDKDMISQVVERKNLEPRDASLKVGLLDKFKNQMKIGDYVLLPYGDFFYVGVIKSDYYYNEHDKTYAHQRKVEWLFDAIPIERITLPEPIQKSIKSRLSLADLSQHDSKFKEFVGQMILGEDVINDSEPDITESINDLSLISLEVIRNELKSDDPNRRLQAAICVMNLKLKI